MVKPTIEKKNTRERIMIKMRVYIVTFEGAYGTKIAEVFTSKAKAQEWIADNANFVYCYSIVEKFAI